MRRGTARLAWPVFPVLPALPAPAVSVALTAAPPAA